jgi:hypothetical protein
VENVPQEYGDTPTHSEGEIRLTVTPPDASIYVNDRFLLNATELPRSDHVVRLGQGTFELTFVRPGYRTHRRRIRVGKRLVELDVELRPER